MRTVISVLVSAAIAIGAVAVAARTETGRKILGI